MKVLLRGLGCLVVALALAGCEGSGTSVASNSLDRDEAACSGSACDPQRPAPPELCGGIAGVACADGMECVDIDDDCDPAVGADCPGRCEPATDGACTVDADCLGDLSCVVCPDGQEVCPLAECAEGRCFIAMPSCAPPRPDEGCGGLLGIPCPDGFVCVDNPTPDCPGGMAADCPGQCVPDVPKPECVTGDDCLAGFPCYTCPDGQELCPFADCVEGQCLIAIPDCAPLPPDRCGGLLGIPCPEGFACVDAPTEECPGGMAADCPGQCVPEPEQKCNDDWDCPQFRVRCTECPDGSYTCPTSGCVEGLCRVDMGMCPEAVSCAQDADCPKGSICNLDVGDGCVANPEGTDCGGLCVPDDRPVTCGGIAGIECPADHECLDDPSDDCDPATGGADCGGVCRPVIAPECKSDDECPQLRAACSICVDGSAACPTSTCDDGHCTVNFPACPLPSQCSGDADCKPGYRCGYDPRADCSADGWCPQICLPDETPRGCGGFAGTACADGFVCNDDPSDECDPNAGGADCPGVCEWEQSPQCRTEADCPQIMAMCAMCSDGSYACPTTYCKEGQCGVSMDACPETPRCGGIAGFECKPGYACIDDPADECDPANGGADCGGICVIEEKPPQCNADSDCMQIMAPCQLCADGSAACPRSFCEAGECRGEFPSCAEPAQP